MNCRPLKYIIVLLCTYLSKFVFAGDKVRIRDVEVITLYQGKMTTGRRSNPVPQLRCAGGLAGCSAFIPQVIQCYNKGTDGYDVQWECKADMDNKYRFGKIDVNCEGYDHPDDPYILQGSCGLEYTIELTQEGYAKENHRKSYNYDDWNGYGSNNRHRWTNSSGIGDLVMLVIVGVIFYMLYSTCMSNRHSDADAVPPPYSQEPNDRGRSGPSAPPPPYSPDPPGFKREYTQGASSQSQYPETGFRNDYNQAGTAGSTTTGSSTNSNSGFWTGAATGGLLGYLLGGRTRTRDNYHDYNQYNQGWGGWGSSYNTPHYGNTGGWFSNWFGGRRSYNQYPRNSYGFSSFGGGPSSSSSPSSSGSRTASGMGGTSRR